MLTPTRLARVSVAVRRLEDEAILVLPDGNLPSFEVDPAPGWQVVEPVNDAMASRGMTVTTLRAVWVHETLGARLYEAVLTGSGPGVGQWTERAALGASLDRSSTDTGLLAAIEAGVLEPSDGALQPWYAPGWHDEMSAWIDERLADAGLRRHGPVCQVRSWGRSALLRIETDRGRVWAKAVPAAFAHEVAVTGLLADVDPGLVPPLIAADVDAGRLLMAHVDGPSLADVQDRTAWSATLARLAETQRVLAAERDRLAVAGVAAAPVETLAEAVPVLLADRALMRVGEEGGLTEAAHARFLGHADSLTAACRALARSGIPDSLDHGDLAASQVIVGEMGPVILDWSDASITHPFLALAAFGADEAGTDAYLGPWTGVAGLREVVRLARLVEPIHLARLYRDRILPGLEQRWEMDRTVPARLIGLLERLDGRTRHAAR
jgi:hypothetical protein